jgi:hypothetical protein
MKKLVIFLLLAELFTAYFVISPTCCRRDHLHAFLAWRKNPTPENNREWVRQKRISDLQNVGFSTVIFGVMAGVTLLATYAWRRKHPALPNETPTV